MKTTLTLNLMPATVTIKDGRTGQTSTDRVVLDYDTVRRCEGCGLDADAIVCRMYNRQGYQVEEITRGRRVAVTVDLGELYEQNR